MTKIIFTLFCLFFSGCTPENTVNQNNIKGKLFIIGGGKLPASMLQEMSQLAGINNSRYIYVLPMASSESDSTIIRAKEDFSAAGIDESTALIVDGKRAKVNAGLFPHHSSNPCVSGNSHEFIC